MLSLIINKKKQLIGIELYRDQDQLDMEHLPFPFRGTIMKLILPPQSSYSKRQHLNFLKFCPLLTEFDSNLVWPLMCNQPSKYFIS